MPISPGGSLYSKEPCQGRVLLSNEVISIALSTEEKHSYSLDLFSFFKHSVQMTQNYMIFVFTHIFTRINRHVYISSFQLV